MKTDLTAMTMLSLCAALCAQPPPSPLPTAAPGTSMSLATSGSRSVDPAARSNMLAKTGGMALSKAQGPALLFLNTQIRVAAATVSAVSEQMATSLRLPLTFKDTSSAEPITAALNALTDTNIAAVIVIGDSAGYPSLLVAPESRWALVNVAALGGTGVSAETLAERTGKEAWRAFGYLMGAANSNYEYCLLKPVFSTADLDSLKPKMICPEPFGKILNHAQKLGMVPARKTTYRKAVEEGWAPAPTNDFQRAIWNELKK